LFTQQLSISSSTPSKKRITAERYIYPSHDGLFRSIAPPMP
jgi:hypothetical protein